MREIKFRGWNIYKDKWIYGDLLTLQASPFPQIFEGDSRAEDGLGIDVHPDSVGQFTGIKDKDGVEIYEGDILSPLVFWERTVCGGIVVFKDAEFCIKAIHVGSGYRTLPSSLDATVVGNIHENPDLLEG